MVKYSNIEPIHSKLKFGLELTELYPPWYLHPSLKNLIYLAKVSVEDSNEKKYDLEEIIRIKSDYQGTVHEGLLLKQRLINNKNIFELNLSPGVPMWLLRHFLGLLPTPIFPLQNDAYHWINLSTKCHKSSTKEVKNVVAKELACLPARNLTFLFEFFELLTSLATDKIVDRNSALFLVKYFAASLFIRPYRSGNVSNNNNAFYSLLLFIVYFWSELRLKIHDIILTRDKNINTIYYFRDKYCEDYYADTSRYLTDKIIQTDNSTDNVTYCNVSDHCEQFDTVIDNKNNYENNLVQDSIDSNHEKQITDKDICSLIAGDTNNNMEYSQFENQSINKEILELTTANVNLEDKENPTLITSTPFKSMVNLTADTINSKTFDEMIQSIKVYLASIYSNPEKQFSNIQLPNKEIENIPNATSIHTQTECPLQNKGKNIKKDKAKTGKNRSTKKQKFLKNSPIVVKFEIQCCQHKNRRLKSVKKKNRNDRIVNNGRTETNCNNSDQSKEEVFFINESISSAKISPRQSQTETKLNATINNESDYIFDSFIGKYYDSTKFNDTSINYSYLHENGDTNVTGTSDMYDRITKFGWTYSPGPGLTSNVRLKYDSTSGCDEIDPYKLCYDIEQNRSMQDSFYSVNVNRSTVIDSLKKVTSKLGFLKYLTPSKLKFSRSMSNENIVSNIKYRKLPKSASSI